MNKIDNLILEMVNFCTDQPMLIQHHIKVHEYVRLIGTIENLPYKEMEILEVAAIIHDLGFKICVDKYGKNDIQKHLEEGVTCAKDLLNKLEFDQDIIEGVSYLVANHHNFSNINRIDHQILIEADLLENFYNTEKSKEAKQKIYNKIFKTESGRKICKQMFGLSN